MADQAIRQELLSVLGRKCFLHLDREGQLLYVTDFPLRNEDVAASVREKLEELGYEIVVRGQALWGIDPGKVKWHEWLEEKKRADAIYVTDETLPLVSLARLWEKNAPADENVLFARKILLSAGSKKQELVFLLRQLCREYALCLRVKKDLPGPGWAGVIREILIGMCP